METAHNRWDPCPLCKKPWVYHDDSGACPSKTVAHDVNALLKADIAKWQELADAPISNRSELVEEARTLLLRASESL